MHTHIQADDMTEDTSDDSRPRNGTVVVVFIYSSTMSNYIVIDSNAEQTQQKKGQSFGDSSKRTRFTTRADHLQ